MRIGVVLACLLALFLFFLYKSGPFNDDNQSLIFTITKSDLPCVAITETVYLSVVYINMHTQSLAAGMSESLDGELDRLLSSCTSVNPLLETRPGAVQSQLREIESRSQNDIQCLAAKERLSIFVKAQEF